MFPILLEHKLLEIIIIVYSSLVRCRLTYMIKYQCQISEILNGCPKVMRYQNDALHASHVDHGWLHTHPSSITIITFNGIKIEQK